jgi:hypothetical protein
MNPCRLIPVLHDVASSFETPACGGLLRMRPEILNTSFETPLLSSEILMVRSAAIAARLEP